MSTPKYPNEIKINPNQGGKQAIERLVEAYGFTTRQALADHLDVSKSTLANRYMRDTFPADWIIQCALETGASLSWLATGVGVRFNNESIDTIFINNKKIINGLLFDDNHYVFDKALLPDDIKNPLAISYEEKIYLVDELVNGIADGEWLIEVEGRTSIRKLTLIPIKRVKISGSDTDFECALEDIKIIAKCRCVFNKKL